MSENNLEDMKTTTKELEDDLRSFVQKTKFFTQEFQQDLDVLKKQGLARETVHTYQKKHLDELKRYLEGIARYLEKETLPYTRKVYLDINANIETNTRG